MQGITQKVYCEWQPCASTKLSISVPPCLCVRMSAWVNCDFRLKCPSPRRRLRPRPVAESGVCKSLLVLERGDFVGGEAGCRRDLLAGEFHGLKVVGCLAQLFNRRVALGGCGVELRHYYAQLRFRLG